MVRTLLLALCCVSVMLCAAVMAVPDKFTMHPNIASTIPHDMVRDILQRAHVNRKLREQRSTQTEQTQLADDPATYESWPLAAEDADVGAANIDHFRIEETSYNEILMGNLWILRNPKNHFSIMEPLGGCESHTRVKVSESAQEYECEVATNAGFFNTHTNACLGNLVSEGKLVQNTGFQNANFGITKDGFFHIGYLSEEQVSQGEATDYAELVAGVIWILRNSTVYVDDSLAVEDMSVQETGDPQYFCDVLSARSAIGHNREGHLMILNIDGKTSQRGVSLYRMAELMKKFGAVNAINLDGGGSVNVAVNGTVVNYPSDECAYPNQQFHCERAVTTLTCIHKHPRKTTVEPQSPPHDDCPPPQVCGECKPCPTSLDCPACEALLWNPQDHFYMFAYAAAALGVATVTCCCGALMATMVLRSRQRPPYPATLEAMLDDEDMLQNNEDDDLF